MTAVGGYKELNMQVVVTSVCNFHWQQSVVELSPIIIIRLQSVKLNGLSVYWNSKTETYRKGAKESIYLSMRNQIPSQFHNIKHQYCEFSHHIVLLFIPVVQSSSCPIVQSPNRPVVDPSRVDPCLNRYCT